MAIISLGGWQLSPSVGYALLISQAFYTTWTLLRNLPAARPVISF